MKSMKNRGINLNKESERRWRKNNRVEKRTKRGGAEIIRKAMASN